MRLCQTLDRTDTQWRHLVKEIAARLHHESGSDVSFEVREATLLSILNEVGREVLRRDLQLMADSYGARVDVEGVPHRRHAMGTVKYHSLCGPIVIRRASYRRMGERNGAPCVPLDLQAALVERATPALAKSAARGYARGHMREHEQELLLAHRRPPSRSTLERMAKRMGLQVHAHVESIEVQLRAEEIVPDKACSIAIGLDRTTAPMEEPRKRGEQTTTRRKRRQKTYVRARPAPVNVNYRMAYVGTFSLCDQHGETLVSRAYASPAHEGSSGIMRRLMEDIRNARRQRPELPIGVIQDGAPELWNIVREAFWAEPFPQWHEIVDYYHVVQHLAAALNSHVKDPRERQVALKRWTRALLHTDKGGDRLDKYLRRARWQRPHDHEFARHAGYFFLRGHQLRYRRAQRLGLPIGSGVTEGACKSLIAQRAKRSGQRWKHEGITAVLSLGGIVKSGRFDPFWKRFLRLHQADIRHAA